MLIIDRRGAIVSLISALLGGVRHVFAAGRKPPGDDPMSADLARLGRHVYSDEGIAMFLACEIVGTTTTKSPPKAPGRPPSDLNDKVAGAFHRYAAEWHRLHPDAPATDVAKIVELLADRDFTNGGVEKNL